MMRIKNYDDALDFLPAAGAPRLERMLRSLRAGLKAAGEGFRAARSYESLVSHGVSPAEAARRAMKLAPAPGRSQG